MPIYYEQLNRPFSIAKNLGTRNTRTSIDFERLDRSYSRSDGLENVSDRSTRPAPVSSENSQIPSIVCCKPAVSQQPAVLQGTDRRWTPSLHKRPTITFETGCRLLRPKVLGVHPFELLVFVVYCGTSIWRREHSISFVAWHSGNSCTILLRHISLVSVLYI